MEYVKVNSVVSDTRKFTEGSVEITAPSLPTVYTAAELVAAVALQTAGQFIHVAPGDYVLTAQLVIPYAARQGGLIGIGGVTIIGAVAADSAIKVMGYAGGTMEYTLGGEIEISGGAGKTGLILSNAAVSQKTILYVKDSVHFIDNGVGVGLAISNTGTGAIRLYVTCDFGTGWDTVTVTQKNADDKFHFRGISFDEDLTASATDIASNWLFDNCQLAHAAMKGGHANNVCNVVNCWTIETAAVAIPDAADFPDAFAPTIMPAS
ncbi:hypothetical protein D4R99_01555 [bacterium]|nr:MAG: hypothetical protein D4R99_01555 [bacterium]